MLGKELDTHLASCWLPSGVGNRRLCTEIVDESGRTSFDSLGVFKVELE